MPRNIFNQRLISDLVILIWDRFVCTFSFFQIKISTSEQSKSFMNSTFIYGTISYTSHLISRISPDAFYSLMHLIWLIIYLTWWHLCSYTYDLISHIFNVIPFILLHTYMISIYLTCCPLFSYTSLLISLICLIWCPLSPNISHLISHISCRRIKGIRWDIWEIRYFSYISPNAFYPLTHLIRFLLYISPDFLYLSKYRSSTYLTWFPLSSKISFSYLSHLIFFIPLLLLPDSFVLNLNSSLIFPAPRWLTKATRTL